MKASQTLKLLILTSAIAISAGATAATQTGVTTVTGNVQQSTACTLSVPAAIDFGTQFNEQVLQQDFTINVTCTAGRPYSLTAANTGLVSFSHGYHYITALNSSNTAVYDSPFARTATGAVESFPLKMQLHATPTIGTPLPATSVGSFTATVPFTLSF